MRLQQRTLCALLASGLLLSACRTPDGAAAEDTAVVHARPAAPASSEPSLPYAPEGLPTDVVLLAVVDEQGRVGDIRVEFALSPAHAEFAIATVREWIFEPAVRDGVKVPELLRIPMSFPNGVPPQSTPDPRGLDSDE
ncbi:MAG: energy transducer TonB [Planctomycetota bacterium]|jgi:protein TonB